MKINLFKRKNKTFKKLKWEDITLRQFYELQNILSVEDEYTVYNVIDYLYGVDCQSLPISKLKNFDISFLKEPIPNIWIKKQYTINGTVYNSNYNLTKISVAQFIDYQNYVKEPEIRLENILSVFFIPQGKDYNKDYDIIKVKEDLLDLPITVAQNIGFFFVKQFKIFLKIFQFSLQRQVKKLKIDKKKKKEILNNLKKMDLWGLVSSLTFLNTVRLQMKQ